MKPITTTAYALLILITTLFNSHVLQAQTGDGRIIGKITDDEEKALDNVNTIIIGTSVGTVTDEQGQFAIPHLNPGKYTIQFSYIGYQTERIEDVDVNDGETVELDVKLSQMAISMPELVVTPGAFHIERLEPVIRQSMTNKRLQELPATLNDINRVIQVMPGVSFSHDGSAHFHVRGGNQDENLILLDGVEIFDPYHLKNLGGAIGILNMDLIDQVNILTGGFPAKYGDKLSSVVNVENKVSDAKSLTGSIGIGGTGTKALLEGPFTKGSWLVSYRRSFIKEAVELLNSEENTFAPSFYDAQGKVFFRLNSSNNIVFNMLMSEDKSYFDSWFVNKDLYSTYSNKYWGFVWKSVLSPKLMSEMIYSNGSNARSNQVEGRQAETLDLKEHVFHWQADFQPEDAHDIQFGIDYKKIRYSYYFDPEMLWFAQQDLETLLETYIGEVNTIPSTYKLATYMQYRWNWHNLLIMNAGARFDHFEYNQDSQISPRLGLAYNLTEKTTLRVAWGHFYQSPAYARLDTNKGRLNNPEAERAIHSIIGIEHYLANGLNIRCEAYYKKLDHMIGHVISVNPDDYTPTIEYRNPHSGYAKGVELFVQGSLTPRLQMWLSYSLSKTKLEASYINWDKLTIEDKLVPRITDQPHNLSLYTSYKLPRNYDLNIKWRLISGRPYTYKYKVFDETADRYVWRSNAPNDRRYPIYSRIDVRIGKKYHFDHFDVSAFLEVQNLLNRKNLLLHDYTETTNAVLYEKNYYMLPFLPSMELNILF
ncbi:TonB-dependent receptor [candidate division KSB1 bacterium]|nr:TonB-dependent receptor [candidate division KSB1 bacterium]